MGCQQSEVRMSPPGPNALAANGQQRSSAWSSNQPLPVVPTNSWYGREFTETPRMTVTDFHLRQRGNVVFSSAPVPVGASELDKLPGRSPLLLTRAVIGKDPVYGMAYLYSSPLAVEHQWRLRVCHYQKACSPLGRTYGEVPGTLSTLPEAPTTDEHRVRLWDLAKQIYEKPFCDTFVGIKVYVDGELVPDCYPTPKSILNCTATLASSEVFNNWTCVPFVLIGYVNSALLTTVSLYRHLSLSFVQYMLNKAAAGGRFEDPKDGEVACEERAVSVEEGCKNCSDMNEECEEGSPQRQRDGATRSFKVTVEVVYGCRAEMNFCTADIAKGSLDIVVGEHSEAALRNYKAALEEVLEKASAGGEQVVAKDSLALMGQRSSLWTCLFCGSPLRFACAICGAELCGMPSCVWKPFTGYPLGCTSHKAQA